MLPKFDIFLREIMVIAFFLSILGFSNTAFSSDEKKLTGTVIDESSKDPVSGLALSLYRLEKPIFSMRRWKKIGKATTDMKGNFSFSINQKGPFEIRSNPEGQVLENEYPVADFESKKSVELVHKARGPEKFPWQGLK